MQKYEITIKDNSIPEHMQKAIPNFHNEYTAIIYKSVNINDLLELINEYAIDLNTDPESITILSIKLIQ